MHMRDLFYLQLLFESTHMEYDGYQCSLSQFYLQEYYPSSSAKFYRWNNALHKSLSPITP
jgi:hypothetical protein